MFKVGQVYKIRNKLFYQLHKSDEITITKIEPILLDNYRVHYVSNNQKGSFHSKSYFSENVQLVKYVEVDIGSEILLTDKTESTSVKTLKHKHLF